MEANFSAVDFQSEEFPLWRRTTMLREMGELTAAISRWKVN